MSPFKVIAFVVNVAIAIYLLYAKRLFGLRGGGARGSARARARRRLGRVERTAP